MRFARVRIVAAAAAALAGVTDVRAVSLASDGQGQALIYPYYTVRSSDGGNAFNTYLSVVNSSAHAKAVRVRVREGRAGREAISFNLYLSPNDMWTAAIVPTAEGARLLTADATCTAPPLFEAGGGVREIALNNFDFSGPRNDGFGDTADRTREGFVEMIEMATLTGASATAVTHAPAGAPANCAAVAGSGAPPVSVAAPTGGLWGTLTLINVNNGQDFTLDATALADLSTRSFFRAPADPYPDFNAAEIEPASVVAAEGYVYRSAWSRPVDAVSAVLMRSQWMGEYVLDTTTASRTDFVATLPTRHHYFPVGTPVRPFTRSGDWHAECGTETARNLGEQLAVAYFNREERLASVPGCVGGIGFCPQEPPPPALCAAVGVASVRNGAAHIPADTTRTALLGSTTRGLLVAGSGHVASASVLQNGWALIAPLAPQASLTSLPASTRLDVATGQVTSGAHTFSGLPVITFGVRNFANGTLNCSGASCQGNYGSAYPFRFRRVIAAP